MYIYIHTALYSILYYREDYVEVARILLEAGGDVETADNYVWPESSLYGLLEIKGEN